MGGEKQITRQKFIWSLNARVLNSELTWARSGRGKPGLLLGGRREKDHHYPTGWQEDGERSPLSYRFCEAAGKSWARTTAGEGGSASTSYVPYVESFFQDFRVRAAPALPGQLRQRGGRASRDGGRRTAALTGAELTPAGVLETAGAWGRGEEPGQGPA